MTSSRSLLDLAEENWRKVVRTEYPLFSDMPVIKAEPNPKGKRHWMFYTDSKEIHMDVLKPDVIEKIFHDTIQKLYEHAYGRAVPLSDDLVHRLMHDTFLYLHFHELFHPAYCPDSKHDEELVDKAIYEGIRKAEPRLDKPDALRKVGNVRNAGWDQLIDGAFCYLSNYGNNLEQRISRILAKAPIDLPAIPQLPDAVVPIFDIVEFEASKEPFQSLFYPLTRALYGLLFTKEHGMRDIVFTYFRDRVTKQMPERDFDSVLPLSLQGFVAELSDAQLRYARIDRSTFKNNVRTLYENYDIPLGDAAHEAVLRDITLLLLDKNTRYDAIKGFIQPLAKYISLQKEEKRHGTHIGESGEPGDGQSGQGQPGQGQPGQSSSGQPGDQQSGQNQPGGNTEAALINLANVLQAGEASDLLAAVANMPGGTTSGQANAGGQAEKDKRLINLSRDEYYKRNVPEILIRSPNYEAIKVDYGKKFVPRFVTSRLLTLDEVPSLPLEKILEFQQETGINQLFAVSDQQWQYDQYEWQEIDDIDYGFENTGLDLPDNVIFHVDSSGSMGSPAYVNTGSSYDILMHVCFGLLKSLRKAAGDMKKEVQVAVANFSNGTILSKPSELGHMYDTPNNEAKKALLGFQNGGTVYSPTTFQEIKKFLKPGKTVHIWATDGALEPGCEESTFSQIAKAVEDPNTSFLYFDIGCSSGFGQRVKRLSDTHPNVQYFPNVSVQDIQNNALEVLLQYS